MEKQQTETIETSKYQDYNIVEVAVENEKQIKSRIRRVNKPSSDME